MIYLWWDAQRTRAVALAAGRRACHEIGAQFLDETVALDRLRPCRDGRGRMRLCRRYQFEFTDNGVDRHRGRIRLRGLALEEVSLDLQNVTQPDGAP